MAKEQMPESVQEAIDTMKGDTAGQKKREKAAKVIENWVGDGASDGYIDRDQAVNAAFADVHGSGALASPIKRTLVDGSTTAPITPTSRGTGIPSQTKKPRDLRG